MPNRPTRLLLDGHQRLSTLLAILGPGLLSDDSSYTDRLGETWVFEISPGQHSEDTRERFVLIKKDDEPSATQLPLSILFDRPLMNRWSREHQEAIGDEGVRLAEAVRDKLREYALPVAVLSADSLDEATESFKRINSSGTPMDTFHMVAALAFREGFYLPEEFDRLKTEYLAPEGWGEIKDTDILRVCAGLLDKGHPAKLDVAQVARALEGDRSQSKRAVEACARAARELREIGIAGPLVLPYSWQLITLAIGLADRDELDEAQKKRLEEWFWVTTYGAVFAGINSAIFDRASEALDWMLGGAPWDETAMARDVTRFVEEIAKFDFRSARVKAFVLLLAKLYDQNDPKGVAHRALAERGVSAVIRLRTNKPRSSCFELAIAPKPEDTTKLRALVRNTEPDLFGPSLEPERLGFPSGAFTKGVDAAMDKRKAHLIELEKKLVQDLGLEWRAQK